ncbi:MAG: DUF3014 domain-containing protein [Gammaproteobacteria bacterium]|nr:DUF3014 domain-containing protein [Gammaproteobacteria bacterium]
MDDPDLKLLIALVIVAVAAGAAWYFRDEIWPSADQPVAMSPEPAGVDAVKKQAPKHPITPPEAAEFADQELVPLPPLDDSDSYLLLALLDVFGMDIEPLLATEALIDKFVATVDNLPRDHVAEKIRPVGRLTTAFRTEAAGGDGRVYLSQDNYDRYDHLVSQIVSADINALVDTYRRFYPLLQQSYEHLGYPGAYFNDRVVEVIDHLLATPQPDEPIRLARPHVLYEFADPELEALSSGQKLLLRMGSEHTAIIKRVLRELRALLAHQ